MVEPHWTAYVQAFGAPFVALVAGGIASVIAYRQWQTAKEKVVLDLFEKRLEVYNLVSEGAFSVIRGGANNIDERVTQPFASGMLKSKFLFGPEVYAYLDSIWKVIHGLQHNARRQDRVQGEALDKLHDKEENLFEKISSFHDKLDAMMAPYMRMDTKLARPISFPRFGRKESSNG